MTTELDERIMELRLEQQFAEDMLADKLSNLDLSDAFAQLWSADDQSSSGLSSNSTGFDYLSLIKLFRKLFF